MQKTHSRQLFTVLLQDASKMTFEQFKEAAAQIDDSDRLYCIAKSTAFPARAEMHVDGMLNNISSIKPGF